MASKRKISTVVAFEGEQKYKQTIDDITKEHRKLKSELELVTAEFKATGDAEKMLTEKSKLLNKQIEGQNKAIKTAEEALKKLKENGVDKTSAAWTHWEKELTSAKTSMFKAQAELNKLNEAYEKAEKAAIEAADATEKVTDATEQVTQATERATQETADYSETLKSIDKGVKFGNILNGLRVVKDAVGGVISTAYRMGKALVMSQVSGGDWAREIMMGAAAADLSVEEYQARQYAQALSGIEYGPIDESIQELRKRLNSTGEDAVTLYKGMNELGIASRETELQALDAAKAFWDIVNALDEIENADTRNTLAERIFGDKYMSIRSLLNYGGEEYLKLIEEGREAATVTEDSVKALADMDSAFEQVKATAKATGHDVQAELAPGFTAMAEAAADVLAEFNEFLDSSEGKAKVAEWNEVVSSFADTIKAADFKTGLEYVEEKLTKIASAFKTIGDTWQAVRDSLNFYEKLFEEGPKAAIDQMTKSKTGENIAAAVTFDDYLWQKNQKFIKEITQQPEEPQPEKTTEGKVTVFSYNPDEGFNAKKQVREMSAAEEAAEKLLRLIKALKEADLSYIADQMSIAQIEKQYSEAFKNQDIANAWQSIIDSIDYGEILNDQEAANALEELSAVIQAAMEKAAESAESGGGGAIAAFNAAIEKGTQDTQSKLKSGVTAAFSGMDSLFASMGTAHGSAYINALSAQMARINSMLSLSPSYAYGGVFSSGLPAYASPTSTSNFSASIYVGREKFGDITTPIVNARMGAEIESIR